MGHKCSDACKSANELLAKERHTWPLIGKAAAADARGDQATAETYMEVARAAEKSGWPKYKPL
jgi:hypothetical protein